MKKVFLIEPVIAHYREDLFNYLLSNKEINFEVIGGNNYKEIKSPTGKFKLFNYFKFRFLKHDFYYLKGLINYCLKSKPDLLIISGVDPHLIHTLILYFIYFFNSKNKIIWWTHGTDGQQGRLGRTIRSFFYRNSKSIIVYSQAGKLNLIDMGVLGSKILVIGNSLNEVDYGDVDKGQLLEKKSKLINLLYCGRLSKEKDLDYLILILSQLKHDKNFTYHLFVIGDGEQSNHLKKLAIDHSVNDSIEFLGHKYGEDVNPYFIKADLFLYPCPIGLSLVHAFSYGLPTITCKSNLHGPEIELLLENVNGSTCELDTNDFVNKILYWSNQLRSNSVNKKNIVSVIHEKEYFPKKMMNKLINFLN